MRDGDHRNNATKSKKDPDAPKNNLSYIDAAHGVQAGVSLFMERDPALVSPKHLRVGVDSCMVNDAALARLLIKKGLFTAEEYMEEVRLEMNRELDRSEARATELLGTTVTLR